MYFGKSFCFDLLRCGWINFFKNFMQTYFLVSLFPEFPWSFKTICCHFKSHSEATRGAGKVSLILKRTEKKNRTFHKLLFEILVNNYLISSPLRAPLRKKKNNNVRLSVLARINSTYVFWYTVFGLVDMLFQPFTKEI